MKNVMREKKRKLVVICKRSIDFYSKLTFYVFWHGGLLKKVCAFVCICSKN